MHHRYLILIFAIPLQICSLYATYRPEKIYPLYRMDFKKIKKM